MYKHSKQILFKSKSRYVFMLSYAFYTVAVADLGEGPAPLFLDQTEANCEKNFLETAPPLSQDLDDRAPPLI